MGERAHMTGRAMDPLPSPAVAAAAEAEADEEADPPATGRARGPMALCGEPSALHSGTTCQCHTSPIREGVVDILGASLFPLLPGTLLFSPPLARGRVELHLGLFRSHFGDVV